jgi:hypothetical protein
MNNSTPFGKAAEKTNRQRVRCSFLGAGAALALLPVTARAADQVSTNCTITLNVYGPYPVAFTNITGFTGPEPGKITLNKPYPEQCPGANLYMRTGDRWRSDPGTCSSILRSIMNWMMCSGPPSKNSALNAALHLRLPHRVVPRHSTLIRL